MEIYVRCYQESADIILEVEDHGKGFDMNDKSSVPKGLGGIGSRNVNDRIHLYFSDDYGMTVSSPCWTGVRLVSISAERPPMDRRPWKWLSACIRISSSVI